MGNWLYEVDFSEQHKAFKRGEISIKEVAQKNARALRELNITCPFVEDFEKFDSDDADDYDIILERLYNWADRHQLWVNTF